VSAKLRVDEIIHHRVSLPETGSLPTAKSSRQKPECSRRRLCRLHSTQAVGKDLVGKETLCQLPRGGSRQFADCQTGVGKGSGPRDVWRFFCRQPDEAVGKDVFYFYFFLKTLCRLPYLAVGKDLVEKNKKRA